jgi:hypothetical protein
VSRSLTVQYDKTIFLLKDSVETRALIGRYIEVYEYPTGAIEVRANGHALPYATYDRLAVVDQGSIVENKRLGHVLQIAQLIQEQRDSIRPNLHVFPRSNRNNRPRLKQSPEAVADGRSHPPGQRPLCVGSLAIMQSSAGSMEDRLPGIPAPFSLSSRQYASIIQSLEWRLA